MHKLYDASIGILGQRIGSVMKHTSYQITGMPLSETVQPSALSILTYTVRAEEEIYLSKKLLHVR